MAESTGVLPGLSPVAGKPVIAAFDGGRLTSDAGVLLLAEIDRRLGICERLARCIEGPRAPERVRHTLAEMIRFRALLIAAGYPDANDCDTLRTDPAFKMAVDAVFVGKERRFHRRFAQMCSHYLVEPVACTPASGWEKGQVETGADRPAPIATLTVEGLRERLAGHSELAVIDVREGGRHAADGHILRSVSLPLNRLELEVATRIPRRRTEIVVYDEGDGRLAGRAARRLAELGYTRLVLLDGGVRAWKEAGFEVFTGNNVIGKAFGEFVEVAYGTPHLSASDVKARLDAGENIAVLDSRPEPEFINFSIPGAIDLPGAELVYRFAAAVPDPETLVVVNCAGRTRSIIGAQALINAGVPNRVVSLANGTMEWLLDGFALQSGKANLAPPPTGDALTAARTAAARLERRFDLTVIDHATLGSRHRTGETIR